MGSVQPALRVPHSLDEAYAHWARLDPANVELRTEWLYEYLLPHWLLLCHKAVQHQQLDSLQGWLEPDTPLQTLYRLAGGFLSQRMQIVLALARDALRNLPPPEEPAEHDLSHYLRTGRWLPAQRAVLLTTALLHNETEAEAVTLRLEWVPQAQASYPHPASLWFIPIAPDFLECVQAALRPAERVRWSIETLPIGASLRGDSLGGAFALGAQLVRHRSADLRAWAILARYDPDSDRLLPVGNFQPKYDAVCQQRRVRRILISDAQTSPPPRATVPASALAPVVRQLHRQALLRRALQLSSLTMLIPLMALLWMAHLGSYQYTAMPSGRVMLSAGLFQRTLIDTGYNLTELRSEQFALGWRWRLATTPAEENPDSWRPLARALLDPIQKSQLYDGLNDPRNASSSFPTTPFPAQQIHFWLQQAKYNPKRSRVLAERIARLPIPAEDYIAQVARLDALHQLGVLTTEELLRALRPLCLPPTDDVSRLQALTLLAQYNRSAVLNDPVARAFVIRSNIDYQKRAYALQVLAWLSVENPYEVLPLAESFTHDPVVQASAEQLQTLLTLLLTPQWEVFYQTVRANQDAQVTNRPEMVALEVALAGALYRFARQRPTAQARWAFLMSQLEDEQARLKGVYRSALARAFLLSTPRSDYPALAQFLRQQLANERPLYQRITLRHLLREVEFRLACQPPD